MKNITTANRGFTLIEIIVSLAVFIVVAVIAVGAFLKILDANKQAQALETAMTNANFALDSMTRDLRVGYGYDCYNGYSGAYPSSIVKTACPSQLYVSGPGTPSIVPAIAFYSSQAPSDWSCGNPPIHAYRFNPATDLIEKAEQTVCNDTTIGDSSFAFVPLTSPSFKIQSFGISVDAAANEQPKIFIYMDASTGSNIQNQTVFTIQTTVSQRIMNGL